MKNLLLCLFLFATISLSAQVTGSRMMEVFKSTTLSASNVLNDPWEIAYGPDGYLWVTESKGYYVYRIDPNTGARTTVLNLNHNSTDLSAWGADSLRAVNDTVAGVPRFYADGNDGNTTVDKYPQGGLAGLALHPDFLNPDSAFVYISYIHRFLGGTAASNNAGTVTPAATAVGNFYRNKLVRFKYNSVTGKLGEPAVLCDTLPGSSDHNSQRIIVAPVTPGGPKYVFYGCGDMGAAQYENRYRKMNAQNIGWYEGKILRFNTKSDGDAGGNAWIPNDNPYGASSAVYSIGIRNNQGFAYDSTLNILYGSSHGAYSDDEINIIEGHTNYGHPMVIGYAADGNYNGTTGANLQTSIGAGVQYNNSAGMDWGNSSAPPIGNESVNAAAMTASGNGTYKDPLYSAYPTPKGTLTTGGTVGIANIWGNNVGNGGTNWSSEAWSGLEIYQHKLIPGWYKSLMAGSLKWGRLVRLRLGTSGNTTLPSNIGAAVGNVGDTICYFDAGNRFRDMAFDPNGKDIYLIMDKSAATSGPSANNPSIPACPGCLIKYTFLGYADNAGKSTIPTSIPVTAGVDNQCNNGTTIVIDNDNKNLWVPITGPDGNIMAEINANGNLLGTVTSSFYKKSGGIRVRSSVPYLDRNITITPQNQPTLPVGTPLVKVRLYISKAEFDALDANGSSGLTGTGQVNLLRVLKNNDGCLAASSATTTTITPTYSTVPELTFGSAGYVLQINISSFSSFYFGTANLTLPLDLVSFSGSLQNNSTTLLNWKTENEINASQFVVERSIDAVNFTSIGTVTASNNSSSASNYTFTDIEAGIQPAITIYYRLKMVDIDGKFKYSNVINVSLATIAGKVIVTPTPTTTIANVTMTAAFAGKAKWNIIDNAGRIVLESSSQLQTGNNTISINVAKLAAGLYYLNVTGPGIDQKVKLQKL